MKSAAKMVMSTSKSPSEGTQSAWRFGFGNGFSSVDFQLLSCFGFTNPFQGNLEHSKRFQRCQEAGGRVLILAKVWIARPLLRPPRRPRCVPGPLGPVVVQLPRGQVHHPTRFQRTEVGRSDPLLEPLFQVSMDEQ